MGVASDQQDNLIREHIYSPLADFLVKYQILDPLDTGEKEVPASVSAVNANADRTAPVPKALATIQRFARSSMRGKSSANPDQSPEALFVENIRKTWVEVSTLLVITFDEEADRIIASLIALYRAATEAHLRKLPEEAEARLMALGMAASVEEDNAPFGTDASPTQTPEEKERALVNQTRDHYERVYQLMLGVQRTRKTITEAPAKEKAEAEQRKQEALEKERLEKERLEKERLEKERKYQELINNSIEAYAAHIIAAAQAAFVNPTAPWLQVHIELLDNQAELLKRVIAKKQGDEQQQLEKELLLTSLEIRKAKAEAMAAAAHQYAHNDQKLKALRAQREEELKYQKAGRAFAALYGLGQGAYCAGFTAMLIGLNYFMNNALVAALGWPSLLLLVVALPIFLTSLSNYWMMRKDMGIMAQQAHDKRHKKAIATKNEKTAKEKLSDNYVWAIVTAVLGGILCSTLTAYGIFQLLPGALGIALPVTFFVITIVPELVLNINHNKKFWAAPIKTMKDAYNNLGEPKYKARFMFWVFASTVGMVFTALALTSLANLVGIPFYVSFPVLCAITLSNVSFYFNRAIDYVSRQKQRDEHPETAHAHTKQLSTGFSIIRLSNAFSNSLVAVIGFLATASSAGLITVHGTRDLALANMTSILNFSAPAVIICLSIAVVVGILAGATSYIANSAGIQEGYESVMKEDLMIINAPVKRDVKPEQAPTVSCEIDKPGLVSHWYKRDAVDLHRYVADVNKVAGTSIKMTA